MKNVLLSCFTFVCIYSFAQKPTPIPSGTLPKPTPSSERMMGMKVKKDSEKRSIVDDLEFRNVGPTIMSGRVVDIDVNPNDPTHFYVAYASGGVWFTNNNGTSFAPVFDNIHEINIGDIAVDWKNQPDEHSLGQQAQHVIWVGTGEPNSSRSSYAGTGVYKSLDGGKNWVYKGLPESHHIGQILISKTDPKTVYVAAIGHLFSFNRDRGLYKTTDGGETWKQVLYIDESTGVIDVVEDPNNSKVIYAIGWHRERLIYNFVESGEKSGIYKSIDGGETFTLITTPETNFPQKEGVGRIGLAIFPGNSNILYSIVDNQSSSGAQAESDDVMKPSAFRSMKKDEFLALDNKKIEAYLDKYRFPKKYTVASIKADITADKYLPVALADFVVDANADLFSRPIIGAEVWCSMDGGKSWTKKSDESISSLFYSYGYYFGKIWVSPFDRNEIYIGGVGLLQSKDGGKSFKSVDGDNQHGDHHAMWLSPTRRGHMINGNDGGLNISWDNGLHWQKCNTPAVGQFYSVNVDMAKPYNIYGGLQDNGVWSGPSTYAASTSWHGEGEYPWKFLLGGDGMQVQIDTRDNNTVYTGYQFGHYYRVNKSTGEADYVRPKMELGDKPLRFSWQTPIWLSQHNQDVLYMGAQRLFRSLDKGETFVPISGDLTRGAKIGDVPYGCLSTINESPMRFGLIYVGSDDGLIHVSKDGGVSWTRISDKLPQHLRVSRVIASSHVEGRVYATLSGCQWDHFKPYLYVSEDYGTTWKQIFTDLPAEAVNVVREDPVNQNLLFVGTDNGLYTSVNRGITSMRMSNGIPSVAVHDLVIHPREHDLVVGTHGRSVYVVPIGAMEKLHDSIMAKPFFVYEPGAAKSSLHFEYADGDYQAYTYAKIPLSYYVGKSGVATIRLMTKENGILLTEYKDSCKTGINVFSPIAYVDSAHADNYKTWLKENKVEGRPEAYTNGKLLPLAGQYVISISFDSGRGAEIVEKEFVIIQERERSPQVPGREED